MTSADVEATGGKGYGTGKPPPEESPPECPAPSVKFEVLLQWSARDAAISGRRTAAVEDMGARIEATKDLQEAYEQARKAQRTLLRELLERLQAIRATVECQVPDPYAAKLTKCFCDKLGESDESVPPPAPEIDCETAKAADDDADLEKLLVESAKITRSIEWLKTTLDTLTQLPGGIGTKVTDLAAAVTALEKAICDKKVEYNRAFVVQLQLRQQYIELRRHLTDSRTYICTIYQRLDELFDLYKLDACVSGAIARLRKKKELEAAKQASAKARLIDEVLLCADPDTETTPPDDDADEVEDLDPCPEDECPPKDPEQVEQSQREPHSSEWG